MSFGIEEAIRAADQLIFQQTQRHLTDVEMSVLRGAWEKLEYDQIAAQNKYATSYISQDAAPKLWKLLGNGLGEKVRKSNFKEALKRSWEKHNNALASRSTTTSKITDIAEDTTRESFSKGSFRFSSAGVGASSHPSAHPESIYIERPPVESMCYEALSQPGALIRIKAPRFMGKTSLANYLLLQLLGQLPDTDYRSVNLSFELADRSTHLTDLNKFLRWMCLNISRELGINPDENGLHPLDEIWDEAGIGAKVSCTAYFEEYLLPFSAAPLVLCLDDVDLLFPYPEVYEDFFGLLRSWYEKARNRPMWKNLRLIIVHATDVYIRLNINQSPFNVGVAVELPEFSAEQVQDFAQRSNIQESPVQVESLMKWVGGHPYLLEQAFTHLKMHPDVTLKALLAKDGAITEVYRNHLKDQWVSLQKNAPLTSAFAKVVQASDPIQLDPMLTYQLQSMGLVKSFGNKVTSRCKLYSEYFKKHLL